MPDWGLCHQGSPKRVASSMKDLLPHLVQHVSILLCQSTADQLCNHLTSLVPVKVSWFCILSLQRTVTSLVIAWHFIQHLACVSSNSFQVLSSTQNHQLFSPAFWPLPTHYLIRTFSGFSPASWPLPLEPSQVFTSILPSLAIGTSHRFSPAFKHC